MSPTEAGDGNGEQPPTVASVAVTPPSSTFPFGTTAQLTATVKDAAGGVLTDRVVSWSSSDTDIATVDDTGLVTGVGPGSTTIKATADGINGTASVTITPVAFASLSAASFRTCGVTTTGAAYCWGIEELNVDTDSVIHTTPRAVAGTSGLELASLDIAGNNTCGVTVGGTAYCWGGKFSNRSGALGRGSTDTLAHFTPEPVVGGHTFVSVNIGDSNTCGVTQDGTAYCWGSNDFGKLGNGTNTSSSTPVIVSGGHTFRSLSAGAFNTCGVTVDDDAYCWGSGTQLGDGTTTFEPGSATPVLVSGGHEFATLSVGEGATCGLTTGGATYCWGDFDNLGGGAMTRSAIPMLVASGITLTSISHSTFLTCGVATDAAAYCWGANDSGQLGDGSTTGSVTPVLVSGGLSFASVTVALFHTCGVTTDDVAYCWGSGYVGVLGNGTTTDSPIPVLVFGQQ